MPAGAGAEDDPRAEVSVVRRIVGTQLAALGLAALGVWSLDLGSERQALIGGLVALAPNLWMARRVHRAGENPKPLVAAGGLFGAMIVKLLIAVGLLALALRQLPEGQGVAFFVGFIAVHLAHRVGAVLTPA
ncbi:MAG: ATP synthase subunit I [Gammaproteobacteria bacterium]|nr:ATP synthase subunit I [Gammaproteobacteria bacterium]